MTEDEKAKAEEVRTLLNKLFKSTQEVMDNYAKAIEEIRKECEKRWQFSDHNFGEVTNAINNILVRLRELEDNAKNNVVCH